MAGNSKLTVAAHALVWIELHVRAGNDVATSDAIARSVNTNPVVIRRLLGQMREAGLVRSRRGSDAGWLPARAPEEITLREVYEAIEPPVLFALHRSSPNAQCPVGFGIQPAMRSVYDRAETAVRAELDRVTLADILRSVLAAR